MEKKEEILTKYCISAAGSEYQYLPAKKRKREEVKEEVKT